MKQINGSFDVRIDGYDWGCGTTKIYLHLDSIPDTFRKEDLSVKEYKQITDFSKAPEFPIVEAEFERTILDAYFADKQGNRIDQPSGEAVIELGVSPSEGSPLLFSMHTQFNTWAKPYELRIDVKDPSSLTCGGEPAEYVIDPVYKKRTTSVDMYQEAAFTASDGVSYKYVYYQPEEKSDVLVIWLHGLGEGGIKDTGPIIPVLANKAAVFAQESFQKKCGKVNVLAPQCPTYWMDRDGKMTNFKGGRIDADEVSFYTESLIELIESHIAKTKAEKVVLAGCSNGGYMTMVLTIHRPDLFDAVIPVCEALRDDCISDGDIEKIKDKPLYFVYSEDDPVVDPKIHEIPTIERLRKAGASDLHVAASEHVFDKSGKYFMPDGKPYQYMGHWSWIDLFNDDCDADGLKAFDFIKDHI